MKEHEHDEEPVSQEYADHFSDLPNSTEAQIAITQRLQMRWLELMEDRLKARTLSDTGMAVLLRFFLANGWNVDPAMIPKNLKDLLGATNPTDFGDDEPDLPAGIIGRIGKQA